jgi:putative addiction module component (TIGR02574 family)
MSLQTELISQVLHLPADDRAELARQIILSLDEPAQDADAEIAWEAEIERRLGQIDRGEVTLLEWRESIERIRANLKRPGPG